MTENTLAYDEKRAIKALKGVTTATLTTILLKKGLRNVWLRGARRSSQASRASSAVPSRCASFRRARIWRRPNRWSSPISTRAAIEDMPEGVIAVVDAMGVTDAGIFGDILCARMAKRGVAALVTDGVVRDVAGVLSPGSRSGARALRLPPRSPASPSSTGRSRSVAAASPCFPTI